MSARFAAFISIAAVIGACSTTNENPIYQQNAKYKASSPYSTAESTTSTVQTYPAPAVQSAVPVTYTAQSQPSGQATYTRVNHECLNKENDRQILGSVVGGAAGALAGNELIGGTKGTVIGAVAGGAAGYGIADKSIDCDPIAVPVAQTQPYVSPAYSSTTSQPTYRYASVAGTEAEIAAPDISVQPAEAPTDAAYGETFGTPGYHAIQNVDNGYSIAAETETITVGQSDDPIIPVRPRFYMADGVSDDTGASTPATTHGARHEIVEGDTVYSLAKARCVGVEDIRYLNNLEENFAIRLGDFLTLPASQC